jgi:hypothetical protein
MVTTTSISIKVKACLLLRQIFEEKFIKKSNRKSFAEVCLRSSNVLA